MFVTQFFDKMNNFYDWFNDEVYKYLLFLYNLSVIKKAGYAFLMGFLAALSLPPLNFFLFLPFTFATIIRMTDFCQNLKQSYINGFWFSFGFFLTGLHWVSFSILNEKSLIWLFPFAFIGVPFVLALFNALIFVIYSYIVQFATAIRKILIFSALWVFFEYLRGFILFQFPWNFLGYSFTISNSLMQITSVIGVLGLSFVIVLWASSFHLLMLTGDKDEFIKYFKFFLFQNILIILIFLFGFIQLKSHKTTINQETAIRIVQGNVKAGGGLTRGVDLNLEKYLSLTVSKNLENIEYIIWPEGSVNSLIFNDENLKQRLANILTKEQILVIGSIRVQEKQNDYEIFNSMIFINKNGATAFYDKNFLVPFGEFVPFKKLIPIPAIANNWKDFSRGNGFETLKLSSKIPPFMPLICYEIAFSGNIGSYKETNPEWILNITNDAWFGYSFGPFQHLQIAKTRGIEEGLPVIRASNNGISAVFDAQGRMLARTALFTEQILDIKIPKHNGSRTIFSITGNVPLITFIIVFLLFSFGEFLYISYESEINKMGYDFMQRKKKKKKKMKKK